MFKKLIKENFLAVLFIGAFYIYALTVNDPHMVDISFYLILTFVLASVLSTPIFFAIPAKYTSIAFGFMFASIGVKFLITSIFFGLGLTKIHIDYVPMYTIFGVFILMVYKFSLFFFANNRN